MDNSKMIDEMIDAIGEKMVAKARIVNLYLRDWAKDERRFSESRPCNKFDFEFSGMAQLVKAMGFNIDLLYNGDATQISSIIIGSTMFKI